MKNIFRGPAIFFLLYFMGTLVGINGYGQNLRKNNAIFELHFDEGFNNTLVEVRDKVMDTIVFKKILNTNKSLGFARSLKLKRHIKYCLISENRTYLINVDLTNFAYVNFINNELTITYSDRKKLYE